jgi:SAM-dependent methyltransferase
VRHGLCSGPHLAFLRDAGVSVFGLDLSPGMIEQARKPNPDILFQVGDMTALTLHDGAFAGIVAFYAIVNIPPDSLPTVFQEMLRVLKPGGLLLLSFHIGGEILSPDELLGQRISMEFFFFGPSTSDDTSKAPALWLKMSLSGNPTLPKWSTKVGGRTSSRENQSRDA